MLKSFSEEKTSAGTVDKSNPRVCGVIATRIGAQPRRDRFARRLYRIRRAASFAYGRSSLGADSADQSSDTYPGRLPRAGVVRPINRQSQAGMARLRCGRGATFGNSARNGRHAPDLLDRQDFVFEVIPVHFELDQAVVRSRLSNGGQFADYPFSGSCYFPDFGRRARATAMRKSLSPRTIRSRARASFLRIFDTWRSNTFSAAIIVISVAPFSSALSITLSSWTSASRSASKQVCSLYNAEVIVPPLRDC